MYAPTLLESRRRVVSRGSIGGNAVSLAFHTALVALAVYATLDTKVVQQVGRLIVDLPVFDRAAPAPPPEAPAAVVVPPAGFTTLAIPTTILTEIPPPSAARFDASQFTGVGVEGGVTWGAPRDTAPRAPVARAEVYAASVLEELPERTGGPAPAYPEMLRGAGIAGDVTVEFVIDTAGRVEPGSVRVVASTHELFSQAVLKVIGGWRFRPGRIEGIAVRSRVTMPVNFLR